MPGQEFYMVFYMRDEGLASFVQNSNNDVDIDIKNEKTKQKDIIHKSFLIIFVKSITKRPLL